MNFNQNGPGDEYEHDLVRTFTVTLAIYGEDNGELVRSELNVGLVDMPVGHC